MDVPEKFKIVISDCHLSAGHFFENKLNVHEDFYFDREMVDLFEYFSTGDYGEKDYGPVEVELFINGDYFDFLNVPYHGEFEDAVTEELSLYKLEAIFQGHPEVMQALKTFASLPGKTITYMIGNHDADLFFPKVRERIIRAWDPEGSFPSKKVSIIVDRDRVRYEGGVEIHHGNQFEAIHMLDFKNPILNNGLQILNIPWGSFYVLKIINRMRCEREFIDKIRPAKVFVFFGLIFDPWFTIRFVVLSTYYFLKTHFVHNFKRKSGVRLTLKMLKQETDFLLDLERQARRLLDQEPEVKTIIFGHTHKPMQRAYPDGKQYINTGTWTKMINLDWRNIGQRFCLSFAFIRIHNGVSECQLRQWVGEHAPHQAFRN